METLQKTILTAYLQKLSQEKGFDTEKIEALKQILTPGNKLKADDVIKILAAPAGGDVK
jgi:hypothetical protein